MKINDVNTKTTGMNPKGLNGKVHRKRTLHTKPAVIADLLFLFRLIQQYPEPFPAKKEYQLYIPDMLATKIPSNFKSNLQQWLDTGKLILLETGNELFEEAMLTKINPGIQLADYIALLAARDFKKSVISVTAIISREAERLQIPVIKGNDMIELMDSQNIQKEKKQKRVRRIRIISHQGPALIAGNNKS